MCEDYDNADWWKREKVSTDCVGACQPQRMIEVTELTETEKKIAHYEERSHCHWMSWKQYGSRVYLYHYKQANIKIRKLKGQTLKGGE